MRLKLLSESQNWMELFELGITLLNRARTKNTSEQSAESRFGDWTVWESVILSAVELNNYM